MKRPSTSAVPRRSCRGFSLIEILAALAVVAVLLAIIVPLGLRSRASAQSAACVANLRQIGVGLQLNLNERGGRFPDLAAGPSEQDPEKRAALNDYLLEYVGGDPQVFICPADGSVHPETGSSYHWNSLLNNQLSNSIRMLGQTFDPSQIPVVFDADSFHESTEQPVNFLFLDGSVDRTTRFRVNP